MKNIKLTVENWSKYNPRADVTKSSWFRLENDLFEAPQFTNFTDVELLAFVYILSMASKANDAGKVSIWFDHAHKNRINEDSLKSAIEKLKELEIVTADVTYQNVSERARTNSVATRRTNETNERTGRDETNERARTPALTPEALQQIWNDKRHNLPACVTIGNARRNKAKAQIKLYPDQQHWILSLKAFTDSRFCTQEWRPGFGDWLDEGKRLKALEGKYGGRCGKTKQGCGKTFNAIKSDNNSATHQYFEEIGATENE